MPKHAEQHYVPKFYLRNFSEDKRRLNLVNIAREKVILGGSLRKQCARTKFYDFDKDMEGDLAQIENRAAPIIRRIIQSDRFLQPDKEYDSYVVLILFVVVQHLRGLRVAAANDMLTDYYAKLMLQGKARSKNVDFAKIKIENKFPAELPLKALPDIMPSAMRLRSHLLVNRSGLDFLTSDDPVVLHNQYCEGIDYQGVLGWSSRGLQAFVALSPRHMLVLFDERVYRMGSRKSHLATEITNPAEVEQCNALQVLHAFENVYFQHARDAEHAKTLVAKRAKDRPRRAMTIVETAMNERTDGSAESLLHSFRPLLRQKLKISAIRWNAGFERIQLHDRGRLIGRPKSFWEKQKGGVRYEISRIISAYDDLSEPLMPAVPPFSRSNPRSS